MKRETLPKEFRRCFGDVDAEHPNIRKYRQFVIGRIFEFGNEQTIRWVQKIFGDDTIQEVVRQSRRISRRTANFCALATYSKTSGPIKVTALDEKPLLGG